MLYLKKMSTTVIRNILAAAHILISVGDFLH